MNNLCVVKLAGRELRLLTDEDTAYVKELAEELNTAIRDAGDTFGATDTLERILLCALDAADRAKKAEGTAEKLRADNTRLLEQLNRLQNRHGRR